MSYIKLIKKVKANLIRLRIHKLLGFMSGLLIYAGYLLRLSKWVDENKHLLQENDFYNRNVLHADRCELYNFYLNKNDLKETPINYIEFGVGRGNSLRWWTKNNTHEDSVFWAFDTYEGLPEQYGSYEKGTFSLKGNFPDIQDERIEFIKGLFQDTLLESMHRIDFEKKSIIHIDADLYSSALFALSMLYPTLKEGDVIIFDEFGVPGHEFKAFQDFVSSFYINLKPIGAVNNYLQMIFEVQD